jgi:hypothetical protein
MVYGTLQIILTGPLSMIECYRFPTHYDFSIYGYAIVYDTLQILMMGWLGMLECNTFLAYEDF